MTDVSEEAREVMRYDFNGKCDGDAGRCLENMEPFWNGDYVLYEDYARLLSENAALKETNTRLNRRCQEAERALADYAKLIARLLSENAALKETNTRLNRRCQEAERALPDYAKLIALPPSGDGVRFVSGNLGRALLASLASRQERDLTAARKALEAAEVRAFPLGQYEAWPECREFYELCQRYRHTPSEQQAEVVAAYEALQLWIRGEVASLKAARQDSP